MQEGAGAGAEASFRREVRISSPLGWGAGEVCMLGNRDPVKGTEPLHRGQWGLRSKQACGPREESQTVDFGLFLILKYLFIYLAVLGL